LAGFAVACGAAVAFGVTALAVENRRARESQQWSERIARDVSERLEHEHRAHYADSVALAGQAVESGRLDEAVAHLESCPSELRHGEWHYLMRSCHIELASIEPGQERLIRGGAFASCGSVGALLLSKKLEEDVEDVELVTGLADVPPKAHRRQVDRGPYRAVAVSPDGKRLATAGAEVRLVDTATGRDLFAVPVAANGVTFSGDGKQMAATGGRTTWVWNVDTGRKTHELEGGGFTLAFSRDGARLAVAGAAPPVRLRVWELKGGRTLFTSDPAEGQVAALALSPDGRWVAYGCECDNALHAVTVRVHDLPEGRAVHTFRLPLPLMTRLAFSPDGRRLAGLAGSRNGRDTTVSALSVWDVETGQVEWFHGSSRNEVDLSYGPDGRLLAVGSWDGMTLYDARTGEALRRVARTSEGLPRLSFSGDGRRLAAGSPVRAAVYDVDRLSGARVLNHDGVEQLTFSPSGRHLTSWSKRDRTLKIWDVVSGKELVARDDVISRPLGDVVVTTREWKTLGVVDAPTGRLLQALGPFNERVSDAAVSPDGRTIAYDTVGGGPLTVRDLPTGREVARYDGRGVTGMLFDSGGTQLALTTGSGGIRMVDARGGEGFIIPDIYSPVFTRDGRLLSWRPSSEGVWEIIVRDPASGRQDVLARGRHARSTDLALSSDGRRLVSAGSDDRNRGRITFWDTETGRELVTLPHPCGAVRTVAFSPDGRLLATGGWDGSVCLFDLSDFR
jgi:WD40 repeat protein